MNVFEYIVEEFHPRAVTSDEGLFQRQESQAAFSLPVVHLPFDAANPAHWLDRGCILDFLTTAGSGNLLDFGPGDGWPSLLVAPFARHVTGVDAAPRRVAVCEANARRLGVDNFRCVHVPAGRPLPFPDNSFDGIMAASSVEQTPDPRATLRELHRVLKPGGRLRLHYEGLSRYRGGKEVEVDAWESEPGVTQLVIIQRTIEKEQATYYGLQFRLPLGELAGHLTGGTAPGAGTLTVAGLERARPWLTDAVYWVLAHPSCRTWLRWAGEVGFTCARATHSGGRAARRVFDAIPAGGRPADLEGVDRLLRPLVTACVELEAPPELDAPITFVK
ncbi:SAM-dependent methyltransferase [Symbiobacterium terraclitae]|uniref:SAM-dependent methyltransferase n=1 Tax=Symbiobacterium terraclitae TaxID=557451 RepID=A0ABS4JR48_9FIRM|nr:SAM-dependent methyltransferase [Symbiobacterium terraclitae]